ncbi:glycoside hydrolase family 2 TIM barrel-domain containing protein [Litchfieldia alkalitelluris]|uniref:glycoside hydrolase family 2 TIM barrel-domain containing protein n=1 Tax=Litchfieldia alkalitelluris TaxID=304268 RepID=UPI000997A436|nr:glycoside hydrolase family 2 TIM barrel-domain containing protein [Litchfieldia alkalitelluris]
MKQIDFNHGWYYGKVGQNPETEVTLPHDAMRLEPRTDQSEGAGHVSWHMGGDYVYKKTFFIPQEYENKYIVFEFEGVYRNAEVYINGEKAMYRPYGYTNFYVDATKLLNYDSDNTIEVIAHNGDQPNSRWYSGSGIYRPVHMYVLPNKHVKLNGIKVKTLNISPAKIEVMIDTNTSGEVQVDIKHQQQVVVTKTAKTEGAITLEIDVPDVKLWSPDAPNLYTCQVEFEDHQYETTFGIRTIQWGVDRGLEINGERVILKGACIHHDNGLLGAAAYDDAEKRKVKILQNVGYNAIRSAHNPCSKAMLDACDELGMLVMDEYVDMWYIHKTRYDYADYFSDWWRADLEDMVNKDYNHPSVILYSTGNEVSETAQERGIKITGEMTEFLHKLDPTRPVTCGVNIFFNYLSSLGFGVYTDEKAKKSNNKKAVGSEFYNKLAGLLGDKTMKIGATLHGSDVKTRDAFANMDIAGYNYGILRYKKDLKKYPNRLILGTETFCKDAYEFLELAKENPRIIGDFVWAGIDYLGEVGIGAWVYEDYAPDKNNQAAWMTAGSGRIDITGREIGEALFTKVALEKTKGPLIAVKPVYQTGKHSPSAWKMTDAMPSWTWPGCEGMKAKVEVYARAASVTLLVNDKIVAKKKISKGCRTFIETPYQKGTITAISYDESGHEIGRHTLKTAAEPTYLTLEPEEETVQQGGLSYIRIAYTDKEKILKPMEKNKVRIELTGGKLLGLGHACPYNPDGYTNTETNTYYGEAMAIVQADDKVDSSITIKAIDNNERTVEINIPIRKESLC